MRPGRSGAPGARDTDRLDRAQVLSLRPPRHDDWRRVHEWTATIESCRYQPWGPNTEAETRSFIDAAVETWREPVDTRKRHVWIGESNTLGAVGLAELHITDSTNRQGEISYSVHTRYWGQGLGETLARRLLAEGFGRHQLHRIVGTCDPRNVASSAILQRIGMTHEGRARHTLLLRDGWRDSELYSILEDEWTDDRA